MTNWIKINMNDTIKGCSRYVTCADIFRGNKA